MHADMVVITNPYSNPFFEIIFNSDAMLILILILILNLILILIFNFNVNFNFKFEFIRDFLFMISFAILINFDYFCLFLIISE